MEEKILKAKQSEILALRRRRRHMLMISISTIVFILAIWQAAVTFNWVSTRFFAGPYEIIQVIVRKITTKKPDGNYLYNHILASLVVVWSGFGLAVVLGIPIGLFMGWFKASNRVIRPLFEVMRPVPPLAWIPVVILFLGVGTLARAAIIFFGAFVSIVLNTYTGIRSTSQTLINVSRTCGASNFETFVRVGIPSAMPMTFTGLRSSMGIAWGSVVAAEMLGSSIGLGFFILYGRTYAEVSMIMGGILVLGICGQISNRIILAVERIVLKWRPRIEEKH